MPIKPGRSWSDAQDHTALRPLLRLPGPLSHASPVERFSLEHPHRPAAHAASARPLQGGGQLIGDWPGGRARGRDRMPAGCSHHAVEMLFLGSASMGYRPVGVGLAGGGGGTSPSPVSCLSR